MGKSRGRAPARTEEGRESQMINLAMKEAERQIREGTASSQIITHFLRLGTEKYKYEQERIKSEVALANAKVATLNSQRSSEELLQKALEAFGSYRSSAENNYYEDEYENYEE